MSGRSLLSKTVKIWMLKCQENGRREFFRVDAFESHQLYRPRLTKIDLMYQWNASDYEKNSSGQERAAEAIISMLELEGHEHILDIGCGDGKVTAKMAALVPSWPGAGHRQLLGDDRFR